MKKYLIVLIIATIFTSCNQLNDTERTLLNNATAVVQLENSKLLASVVADSLEVTWDILIGTDNWLWYTEQKGSISRVHLTTGKKQLLKQIEEVHYKKSRGLLSMTLHPQFKEYPFVFVHYNYSYQDDNLKEIIKSRVVRFTFAKDTLTDPLVVLDKIPGKTYHNGSRMLISPDQKLFFAFGDAGEATSAQDPGVLNGKIMRINLDGSIPADNPIPNSPVWSWGHRNVQGVAPNSQ